MKDQPPLVEIAVEPKTKADQEKMGVALHRLAQEDPSFRVSSDQESGETIIKGMGELHLEILVDRMKREFKVEANVGAPQVAYRESLAKPVELVYTHKKQSGGSGQFGEVKVALEPGERGAGIQVVEAMVPLANMFGYVNELRSFSQGRAQYTMQFSHYDEVPANVAEEIKSKLA